MRGARGASPSSAPGSGLLREASPSRRAPRATRKPRQAKRRGRIRKERPSNRGPGVRRYDKARIRRTRALCTAVRLARYGERLVCVRYRYDSATGRRVKTAELIVQDIAWAGRARKPRPQRPRASRRSDRLERERTARGSQARGRYLEAATAAMGTLLGRSPHFGPARPGRRRIFRDKTELEYIAAYGAMYR